MTLRTMKKDATTMDYVRRTYAIELKNRTLDNLFWGASLLVVFILAFALLGGIILDPTRKSIPASGGIALITAAFILGNLVAIAVFGLYNRWNQFQEFNKNIEILEKRLFVEEKK